MPILSYNRHNKTRAITLRDCTTTLTMLATTSSHGSAVTVSGYKEMSIVSNIIANSSGSPDLLLQVSADGGTNWVTHTTLKSDCTTTANKAHSAVTNFGQSVRVTVGGTTTTCKMRFTVKAVAKA